MNRKVLPLQASMPPNQNNRLDSWKEIAEYLGRDVSTVIRWEKEKGLPVHRIPGGKRQAVFAYRAEIDAWLAGLPVDSLAEANTGPAARPASTALGSRFRLNLPFAIVFLLVLAGAISGILAWRWSGVVNPVRAAFLGNRLVAQDAHGQMIWSYEFSGHLHELPPNQIDRWIKLTDLDGDGRKEILAVPTFLGSAQEEFSRSSLFCFSAAGKLEWRYEPAESLSFGEQTYKPPWAIGDLLAIPGSHELWVSVLHDPWWPSYLAKLDRRGHGTVQFVNTGHIRTLNLVRNDSGSYLLASGTNNELDGGMLAILKPDQLPATSPRGSVAAYHCDGCPSGVAFRYFVFPRSELNRVLGAPINGAEYLVHRGEELEVRTKETQSSFDDVDGLYALTKDFELRVATRTDRYWAVHRRLEQEGKIKHSVEQCPERIRPIPVRMWTSQKGWSIVQPQQPRPGN